MQNEFARKSPVREDRIAALPLKAAAARPGFAAGPRVLARKHKDTKTRRHKGGIPGTHPEFFYAGIRVLQNSGCVAEIPYLCVFGFPYFKLRILCRLVISNKNS